MKAFAWTSVHQELWKIAIYRRWIWNSHLSSPINGALHCTLSKSIPTRTSPLPHKPFSSGPSRPRFVYDMLRHGKYRSYRTITAYKLVTSSAKVCEKPGNLPHQENLKLISASDPINLFKMDMSILLREPSNRNPFNMVMADRLSQLDCAASVSISTASCLHPRYSKFVSAGQHCKFYASRQQAEVQEQMFERPLRPLGEQNTDDNIYYG